MMEFERPFSPLSIILVAVLLLSGCRQSSQTEPSVTQETTVEEATTADQPPEDFVGLSRRMHGIGDFEKAAEAAYKALLQDPENVAAKLVAASAEAGRGNHQTAAEIAGSIDLQSRMGQPAVEIRFQQLLKLDRHHEAADVMLDAIKVIPGVPQWRHDLWSLLTRIGRREEASHQALALCYQGLASEPELLSLVRRTDSFPTPDMLDKEADPNKYFQSGLGMARWYFSQQDYRQGLHELQEEYESGFRSTAACALYGRLLAETQSLDEIVQWHGKCGNEIGEFGDYWAALGTYFFDLRQYEASVKALLNAVVRNPTDRTSIQRLAKVFDALGRSDDAMQFRHRGIKMSETERSSEATYRSSADISSRQQLTRQVMELGRPFETLQWTLLSLPASAVVPRNTIAQQRQALLQSQTAMEMATESALIGIDPTQFSLESSLAELLRQGESPDNKTKLVAAEILAMPRLVNVASQVGLNFQWYQDVEINLASIPIHESVGGGIAVLDYDLDGWPDVYLAQGSGEPPTDACTRSNILQRNIDSRFVEVTSPAMAEDFNYSSGLAAGDVNQDGFPDLYLGSLGHNRLLLNNGDGTFRDATDQLGDVNDRFTTSLAIADINGDALPDLFEAIYIEMEGAFDLPKKGPDGRELQPSPLLHYADSDRWFENLGDGKFQVHEITREVAKPATSLGVVVTDFDANGNNEVFVGNDVRPNHFLVQTGDNQFSNAADARGVANGFSGAANGCMGIASGDFDRDGRIDLHITNFSEESVNLYLQAEGGGFTDFANRYQLDSLSMPYVGFGTKAVDVDRNGWLDLIVTNGHIFDMRFTGEQFQMSPQFLMGTGRRFELVTVQDESGYWDDLYLGRAIATVDFDRDGSIDFLIGHLDKPLALLRNETPTPGNWIQFELVGTASERDAIGARLVLNVGDEQFTQWVTAGDGYFCSDEAVVDFGFANSHPIDSLDVHWPSGARQTISKPESGHRYLVVEGESEPVRR